MALLHLPTGDDAVHVSGAYVSANFFDVLGVSMARGRGFLPEDEHIESPNTVAVISHRLWQTQFDGTLDIIGRTVRLNGRPFTIVGVAPLISMDTRLTISVCGSRSPRTRMATTSAVLRCAGANG
jgi:hypothetical protein